MLIKIKPQLKSLASHHCDNILRTIFGIYVSQDTGQITRKNISLIAVDVWTSSKDQIKYKLGLTLEGYNNNLHAEKYRKGVEFFTLCSGNRYRTESERLIALNELIESLDAAHRGWDNFYNEVPIAEEILTYIEQSSDVPTELAEPLIHTMLQCRLGRGINYNSGVSPRAKVHYDRFFNVLGDDYIPAFIVQLTEFDIEMNIANSIRMAHLITILSSMRKNIINERYQEAFDYLITEYPKNRKAARNPYFRKLTGSFIDWEEVDG
jgi:hypothetical protein